MDIKDLQERVIAFREARDWARYHNPKDLAISLVLEAGELLEIFQWKDPGEVDMIGDDQQALERIKEELGDILIYVLYMSHSFELDPSDIVMSKLRMNEKKYPVEKAKGSAKKYNEL